MPSTICRICKKPLKQHTSIVLGIGPVCQARDELNMDLDLFPHADFIVQEITDAYIYIKDKGGNYKSVTSDAAFIVEKLSAEYDIKNRRIFYTDTMGQIDEITHNGGHFTGYKAGHEGVVL